MTILRTATALGVAVAAPAAGVATASPAFAGGVGVIAGPAFDNTCATRHRVDRAVGRTAHGPGVARNLAQLPLTGSYQHCGGADLDSAWAGQADGLLKGLVVDHAASVDPA
ncbi:hypothetical protein ABZ832_04145 [Streptantibioticus parmotrematis]|uniref:hypothetical protein n=1 Tax=Streptantibioticus parmotrematis TaxID=2873249 RepID=UPI0033E307EC